MGPKQSNIRNIDINHPQLEKSKVFTRDKVDYIETLITLEQKDYEKWRKDLKIT